MPNSTRVLAHILTHRELKRKDMTEVVGFEDRKSRRVTAMLHKRRIIAASTHRAAFRIAFPAALAPGLMPIRTIRDCRGRPEPNRSVELTPDSCVRTWVESWKRQKCSVKAPNSNPTPSAKTQISRKSEDIIKVNYFTSLGAILALFSVRNSLVQSMNKTWVQTSVDGGTPGVPG
jgi:hypothetical protein